MTVGNAGKYQQRGFSLVEFMVAMTLGLILIAGAVSVYLGTKRSYNEVEQVASLAENSRFAVQVLNDSLRHAGFFGGAHPRDIVPDVSLGAVAGDCTGDATFFELGNYLLAGVPSAAGGRFRLRDRRTAACRGRAAARGAGGSSRFCPGRCMTAILMTRPPR